MCSALCSSLCRGFCSLCRGFCSSMFHDTVQECCVTTHFSVCPVQIFLRNPIYRRPRPLFAVGRDQQKQKRFLAIHDGSGCVVGYFVEQKVSLSAVSSAMGHNDPHLNSINTSRRSSQQRRTKVLEPPLKRGRCGRSPEGREGPSPGGHRDLK